jgi:hypothetical protein
VFSLGLMRGNLQSSQERASQPPHKAIIEGFAWFCGSSRFSDFSPS